MKQLKNFAIAALALLGLASCQPDPEAPMPEIKLGESEVVLLAEGGESSIGYMIENAVEGEKITVTYEADWLTVSTSKVRSIEFSAPLNDSGAERSVEVTLSYKGAEDKVVTVRQEYLENPFEFEIQEVTATEVVFSVRTTDPELTWIPSVQTKEYYDYFVKYYSVDKMIETDIELLQYTADNKDMSLEALLEQVLAVGDVEDIYFDGLDPDTEYVLYAFGLTPKGERTTSVVVADFKTEKAWEGDITVEFTIREENHVLSYDATPSHTGVPYFCHYATESEIEAWKEEYGTDDLKTLIQKGCIQALYDGLHNIGYMDDISEFYEFFNNDGRILDNYFGCKASTKYIFFAAKWDAECNLVGEVSTLEYTTQPVAPSDNQITLSVANITQSTADVTITTTNNDPYAVMAVPASDLEGMTEEEIFEYVDKHYYLSEFTFTGNKTRTYSLLESNTEYMFVAFGYKAKSMNTATMATAKFYTLPSSDPSKCTFEFEYQIYDSQSMWVKVTPSDMGHWYYWGVFDARFTADGVKTYITDILIGESYEGDPYVFASWWLKKGTQSEDVGNLYAATDYRIAAVVMDYNTGEFLTEVAFSETFTTPEAVYAEIEFSLTYDDYYDIDELAAEGVTEYREAADLQPWKYSSGGAVLPVKMNISGSYSKYYYYLPRHDLTDTETYNDQIFIDDLIYTESVGSSAPETNFLVGYDQYWTLVGVAMDTNGVLTSVYREKIYLTKDGSSPVSEFIASQDSAAPLKVSVVEWNNYNSREVGTRIPEQNLVVEIVDIEQCNLAGRTKALRELINRE